LAYKVAHLRLRNVVACVWTRYHISKNNLTATALHNGLDIGVYDLHPADLHDYYYYNYHLLTYLLTIMYSFNLQFMQ